MTSELGENHRNKPSLTRRERVVAAVSIDELRQNHVMKPLARATGEGLG